MSTLEDRIAARQAHPSTHGACSYIVGRNRQGAWIALEMHGRAGGIFVSRDAALHYAAFETDHRSGAVHFTSQPLELRV